MNRLSSSGTVEIEIFATPMEKDYMTFPKKSFAIYPPVIQALTRGDDVHP